MNCQECGAALTAARSDAAYCSNACRQKAYRARDRALSADRVEIVAQGMEAQGHHAMAEMVREAAAARVTRRAAASRNAERK